MYMNRVENLAQRHFHEYTLRTLFAFKFILAMGVVSLEARRDPLSEVHIFKWNEKNFIEVFMFLLAVRF